MQGTHPLRAFACTAVASYEGPFPAPTLCTGWGFLHRWVLDAM